MRRFAFFLIGFLVLAAIVGFLVTSGGRFADELSGGGGGAVPAASSMAPKLGAVDEGVVSAETTRAPAAAVPAGDVLGAGSSAIGALPPIGLDVVKTAQLSIEVAKSDFGQAFGTATLVAGRYGGYVESSSMAGAKTRSGNLTIRVPATSFDDAMRDLRALGTVERQSIEGRVVTAGFIDLQARLRTWQAQEAVLLGLMRRANSIEATLRVQRELQDVQFRIEQIRGQLRVLEDQTSLATIQVGLHEAGAPVVVEQKGAGERPSLSEAWTLAVDAFLGVVYVTVVGLGYLVPVTAIALLAWFGYRRLHPRVVASP